MAEVRRREPEPISWPLPLELTMEIIQRSAAGSTEFILCSQTVCKVWYRSCKEKEMFQHIKFKKEEESHYCYNEEAARAQRAKELRFEAIVKCGIDRSERQLLEFHISNYYETKLLLYMANRADNLRSLTLEDYSIPYNNLASVLRLLPNLEELHLILAYQPEKGEEMRVIGGACPSLRAFTFHQYCTLEAVTPFEDHVVIGEVMPRLRSLSLISNRINNEGLNAILDSCTELKSLDVRDCRRLVVDATVLNRCRSQLDVFKLPGDSMVHRIGRFLGKE